MQLEVFEGGLGQVEEFGGEPAGFGVGLDRADELGVDAETRGGQEEAVLVARLRFADVDGAFEAFGQRRGADREGADLGGVGAFAPGPRSRSWLGLPCIRSGRRRRRG